MGGIWGKEATIRRENLVTLDTIILSSALVKRSSHRDVFAFR
jgi:hypothetical protein